MHLDTITVTDMGEGIARNIVEAVEQLPMNVPDQKDCWVKVDYHRANPIIMLSFLYSTVEKAEKTALVAPDGASNIKPEPGNRAVEFDYKGLRYRACVGVDD